MIKHSFSQNNSKQFASSNAGYDKHGRPTYDFGKNIPEGYDSHGRPTYEFDQKNFSVGRHTPSQL